MKNEKFYFRLSTKDKEQLEALSNLLGVSISSYILQAVHFKLAKDKKDLNIN